MMLCHYPMLFLPFLLSRAFVVEGYPRPAGLAVQRPPSEDPNINGTDSNELSFTCDGQHYGYDLTEPSCTNAFSHWWDEYSMPQLYGRRHSQGTWGVNLPHRVQSGKLRFQSRRTCPRSIVGRQAD